MKGKGGRNDEGLLRRNMINLTGLPGKDQPVNQEGLAQRDQPNMPTRLSLDQAAVEGKDQARLLPEALPRSG